MDGIPNDPASAKHVFVPEAATEAQHVAELGPDHEPLEHENTALPVEGATESIAKLAEPCGVASTDPLQLNPFAAHDCDAAGQLDGVGGGAEHPEISLDNSVPTLPVQAEVS